VSPHDGLGSNLVVQVKQDRVMRVVPYERPELNECWLSDKDRFAYEGLNSADRLTRPMLRQGGEWREVDWEKALAFAAEGLRKATSVHGAAAVGALVSPHATLEEMHLAQKLVRGLGAENVDFRLRQSDFAADGRLQGAPWLGMKVAELGTLDRVLVVGAFLRKDQPLIAHRLGSIKLGQQVSVIHVAGTIPIARASSSCGRPSCRRCQVASRREEKGAAVPPALGPVAVGDARRDRQAPPRARTGIFLGNSAQQHPRASQLHVLRRPAGAGARFGFRRAANSVGGHLRCVPARADERRRDARVAGRPIYRRRRAELDTANSGPTGAMDAAEFVSRSPPTRAVRRPCRLPLPVTPFRTWAASSAPAATTGFNPVEPLGDARLA
jgi:NADH-quinone oxidoreductase subunit G